MDGKSPIKPLMTNMVYHLLEVIDALAYQLACYKYPNHKVHNFDDKEEILTDVGLDDCFKRELVKER